MSVVNRTGIDFNYECALIDVQCQVNEVGNEIRFEPLQESDYTRDSLRSFAKNDDVTGFLVYSYPTDFTPNEKSIERAGLREDVDIILHTSKKSWDDQNITYDDLDILRYKALINGQQYKVVDKNLYGQLGNNYLYYIIGLTKE